MTNAPAAIRKRVFARDVGQVAHQKAISELLGDDTVEAYRNLHKKCWSVRRKGKVVLHTDSICLTSVDFVVQEVGRQRVILEKRKNVHAFVRGQVSDLNAANEFARSYDPPLSWASITYNPYFNGKFVDLNGEDIVVAPYANMFISDDRTDVFALL